VLEGSPRNEPFTRKPANPLKPIAPAPLPLQIVEIRDLDLYNPDLEAKVPPPWLEFRDRIRRADALLFTTPEYNRSVPGLLKNAIDVGSRPAGKSVFEGKPGAVVSNSPGMLGGFGANHHLRQALVFLNVPTMQQPEAYIGGVTELFDADGKFAKESTRQFVEKFLVAFAAWIETTRRK
jgi:chromate reductase